MKKLFLFLCLVLLSVLPKNQASASNSVLLQDTLRLLAIGNSFSEDALENYLYELASTSGKTIIIGNLYIGGAPIHLHVKNATEDNKKYSYRKTNLDGKKTTTKDVSIAEAMQDEHWTHISLQQASPLSGQYDKIMESLPQLLSYVRGVAPTGTKIVYHQTWAYQQDSPHKGFANYNNDQKTMYQAIADATKHIANSGEFAYVVPAGTAIQNARTSSQGDTYTRDGYHLELAFGRFTAACTWYEKLFNLDVRKNPYKPESVSDLQAKIAKDAAHKAVKKPFKISKVKL